MKFYCSSILPLPPLSLFLSLFFPPLLSTSQARHTNPLETKLPDAGIRVYTGSWHGRQGPIGCAGLSKHQTTKLFSKANPPAGHRAIYHIALTNRDGDFDSPGSLIALSSRNLNPLLQFSARLWRIYDTYLEDRHLRPPLESGRRARVSSVSLGQANRHRLSMSMEGGGRKKADRDYRTLDEWSYSAVGISGGHCLSINHWRGDTFGADSDTFRYLCFQRIICVS